MALRRVWGTKLVLANQYMSRNASHCVCHVGLGTILSCASKLANIPLVGFDEDVASDHIFMRRCIVHIVVISQQFKEDAACV